MAWPADAALISEDYTLSYTVTDTEFGISVTSESYAISIRERCQDPFFLLASTSTINDSVQTYTIFTDPTLRIEVPVFTPLPGRCQVSYSQSIDNVLGE